MAVAAMTATEPLTLLCVIDRNSFYMNCEHPKIVYNQYLKRKVFVPCGKCRSCLISHQNILFQKIKNECDKHRFNIFFTLTYSNQYIPTIRLHDNNIYRGCFDDSEILDSSIVVLDNKIEPNLFVRRNKLDIPLYDDRYGVLYYKDIQNFFKKLRNALQYRFEDTKIPFTEWRCRFAVCCEYGSFRHRPHYHGILHFNNEEVANFVLSKLPSFWSFCDWDKISAIEPDGLPSFVSSENGAKYISKYTTKYDLCFDLAKYKDFMPKVKYSKKPYYGLSTYDEETIGKILSDSPYEIEQFVNKKSDSFNVVRLSSSVQDFLYRRFSQIDDLPFARLVEYCIGYLKPPTDAVKLFVAKVRKNVLTFFKAVNSQTIRLYIERVQRFIVKYKSYQLKSEMLTYDEFNPKDYVFRKYQTIPDVFLSKSDMDVVNYYHYSLEDEVFLRLSLLEDETKLLRSIFHVVSLFGLSVYDFCIMLSRSPASVFSSDIQSNLIKHKSYVSTKMF